MLLWKTRKVTSCGKFQKTIKSQKQKHHFIYLHEVVILLLLQISSLNIKNLINIKHYAVHLPTHDVLLSFSFLFVLLIYTLSHLRTNIFHILYFSLFIHGCFVHEKCTLKWHQHIGNINIYLLAYERKLSCAMVLLDTQQTFIYN